MNTRLQVEHPVTEMITGLDLVEWQLRVAAGEPLPLPQDRIVRRGHAIEARLYAEDPARDFLPQAGLLACLRFPAEDGALRVETGLREGDTVGVHYDALLAKLVAWGADRAAALDRLAAALAETRIGGIVCNRDFLARVLRHGDFAAGDFDTGFIARHRDILLARRPASFAALAAATLAILADRTAAAKRMVDPHSPWHRRDGWRLGPAEFQTLHFLDGDTARTVRAQGDRIECDGRTAVAALAGSEIVVDGDRVAATVVLQPDVVTAILADETCRLVLLDPLAPPAEAQASAARLTAPMPGKVLAVHVAPGARVERGQLLMVIEAMKMEHAITAPAAGVVEIVHYVAGDVVAEGALLLAFAAAEGS
jgi:3-methylcrotonyl-CoA carboxylase alpha subunit